MNRKVLSWAFYDWANSAFALSVLAVLFPLFLGRYWSADADGATVTARLTWITAASSLVVLLIAPVFGTIADAAANRKRFLLLLTILGASTTAALGLLGKGEWQLALALYLFAMVGYYGSTVFYDSLIIDVTEPKYYSFVSSLGFSIGYLGGAVLLASHVWMISSPATLGLDGADHAIRVAFVSVGAWWLLFAVPILAFVSETVTTKAVTHHVIRAAYLELRSTMSQLRQYRNVVIFLIAYWLYIGGVFTVIYMAVNYGQRLGFADQDLVTALMITNFVGFPATFAYGIFGHKFGAKRGLYFALAVYISVSSWAVFMTDVQQFYVMAIIVGCVQGGVQGLSRSLYAALIPKDAPGEFFGFYNMVTKAAHVLGPVLVGVATFLSDDPEAILIALLPLFIGGGVLLTVVRQTKASE